MKHSIWTGIGLLLCIALFAAACSQRGKYLTVEEVWKNAKSYDGKIIRVQGKADYTQMMTMVLCQPSRCDCNEVTGSLYLVNDPPSHVNDKYSNRDTIWVKDVDCHGDECSITCSPIQPKTGDVYEFTGKLAVTYQGVDPVQLQLTGIDSSSARVLVDGAWKPIPTGTFTTQLRTYGCPGAPDTRLIINDIARASVNPPLPLHLHSTPGISGEEIGQVEPGGNVKVLDGPKCADNYTWFLVRSLDGQEGWAAEGDQTTYWLADPITYREQLNTYQSVTTKTFDLREIRISPDTALVSNIEGTYLPLETPVPTPLTFETPWPDESRESRAGMEDEWVNYAAHSVYKLSSPTRINFMSVFDLQDPLSRSYIVKKNGVDCIPAIRENLNSATLQEEDVHPFCGMNGSGPLLFIVNIKTIQFTGGKGLRYLITYSLNGNPRFLDYIFQGLSDDDRYFIYLFAEGVTNPYSYPTLEDEQSQTAFNERMKKLLDAGMVPLSPSLEVLDAMMSSIEIK